MLSLDPLLLFLLFSRNIFANFISSMETTLVLLKPDCILRGLTGKVIDRFVSRGLIVVGLKMLQASDEILTSHYAHIADKPFFPGVMAGMQRTPIIAIALAGKDAAAVARSMAGATNARMAAPGTLRAEFAMSIQQNIVHISEDSAAAVTEVARFFAPEELFGPSAELTGVLYGDGEL